MTGKDKAYQLVGKSNLGLPERNPKHKTLVLGDKDLWGLRDVLNHALDDGYLEENRDWGLQILDKINALREA